jgi:hypothetical protein
MSVLEIPNLLFTRGMMLHASWLAGATFEALIFSSIDD